MCRDMWSLRVLRLVKMEWSGADRMVGLVRAGPSLARSVNVVCPVAAWAGRVSQCGAEGRGLSGGVSAGMGWRGLAR